MLPRRVNLGPQGIPGQGRGGWVIHKPLCYTSHTLQNISYGSHFCNSPGARQAPVFPIKSCEKWDWEGLSQGHKWALQVGPSAPWKLHTHGGQLDGRSNRCACFPIPTQNLDASLCVNITPADRMWMRVSSPYRLPEKGCANGAHPHFCLASARLLHHENPVLWPPAAQPLLRRVQQLSEGLSGLQREAPPTLDNFNLEVGPGGWTLSSLPTQVTWVSQCEMVLNSSFWKQTLSSSRFHIWVKTHRLLFCSYY